MGIGMDAYEQMGRELFEKSQGAPILLIGMGGVGGRIVAQIDKMLAKDSPGAIRWRFLRLTQM